MEIFVVASACNDGEYMEIDIPSFFNIREEAETYAKERAKRDLESLKSNKYSIYEDTDPLKYDNFGNDIKELCFYNKETDWVMTKYILAQVKI